MATKFAQAMAEVSEFFEELNESEDCGLRVVYGNGNNTAAIFDGSNMAALLSCKNDDIIDISYERNLPPREAALIASSLCVLMLINISGYNEPDTYTN